MVDDLRRKERAIAAETPTEKAERQAKAAADAAAEKDARKAERYAEEQASAAKKAAWEAEQHARMAAWEAERRVWQQRAERQAEQYARQQQAEADAATAYWDGVRAQMNDLIDASFTRALAALTDQDRRRHIAAAAHTARLDREAGMPTPAPHIPQAPTET